MGHIRSNDVVASALRDSDAGMRDAENAAKHGVAVKTVRRWRRIYQRRGLPRGQAYPSVPCPRCDGAELDEAAYAELFGWYLGDGHIVLAPRGVYTLSIKNDIAYPRLNRHIGELMARVKPGRRPNTRMGPGCVITQMGWKHWPCLFPQHGPGRKHQRVLGMTDWQWRVVERHPADFLRGLFHSDGNRGTNWTTRMVAGAMKRYEYPRWQFTNYSIEIMLWCTATLDALRVDWRPMAHHRIAVSRREAVARLDELIGLKQ